MMQDTTIHKKAHAKINLTLEVTGKLANGYHTLRTVMMRVPQIYDDVAVTVRTDTDAITITCDDPSLPTDERNLCHKVVQPFRDRVGRQFGVGIALTKRIPMAAGMGGGSSDGAAVLSALQQYHGDPLIPEELAEVASGVGKDLPFFLTEKGCARMEHLGDVVVEEFDPPQLHLLTINPGIAISTPEAYGALVSRIAELSAPQRPDATTALCEALRGGRDIAPLLHNDFEQTIFAMHPTIGQLKQSLVDVGATGALMSGSGSSVFGLFASQATVEQAKERITALYPHYYCAIG